MVETRFGPRPDSQVPQKQTQENQNLLRWTIAAAFESGGLRTPCVCQPATNQSKDDRGQSLVATELVVGAAFERYKWGMRTGIARITTLFSCLVPTEGSNWTPSAQEATREGRFRAMNLATQSLNLTYADARSSGTR